MIEGSPGEVVYSVIRRAIDQCNRDQREHQMKFNDTVVRVYPGSHEYDIAEKWDLQRRLSRVG